MYLSQFSLSFPTTPLHSCLDPTSVTTWAKNLSPLRWGSYHPRPDSEQNLAKLRDRFRSEFGRFGPFSGEERRPIFMDGGILIVGPAGTSSPAAIQRSTSLTVIASFSTGSLIIADYQPNPSA